MQLARIINGTVQAVGDYRSLFPQTSFSENGPTQSFLSENGCLQVSQWKAHDRATQKLVVSAPYIEDDFVYTVVVEPLSSEDLQSRTNALAASVRAERKSKLLASDWTQLADAVVEKAAWASYRQLLRDLPQQEGFPDNVVWPTAPDAPVSPIVP